jgi:hypothetical protein
MRSLHVPEPHRRVQEICALRYQDSHRSQQKSLAGTSCEFITNVEILLEALDGFSDAGSW